MRNAIAVAYPRRPSGQTALDLGCGDFWYIICTFAFHILSHSSATKTNTIVNPSTTMSPLSSMISRATTLPSTAQLRRSRTWISRIANAFFVFWVWRFVYLEAYRYVRAKGMIGVGQDGINRIKRVSCPLSDALFLSC